MSSLLTLGADIEFLVRHSNGSLASVEGLIGGSKVRPRWVKYGNYQEDNVLAEMAINPCSTIEEWKKSLSRLKSGLNRLIGRRGFMIDISPSAFYPEELLTTPQAKQFGCDPDYNAWEISTNNPPDSRTNLRSAGGHIHVELPEHARKEELNIFNFCRWMDLYLGVPSVLYDKDKDRRKLYGKAGAFRPKSYGMEYRTLSNFWVKSPKMIKWAWDQTHAAYGAFEQAGFSSPDIDGDLVRECINNGNEGLAEEILGVGYGG